MAKLQEAVLIKKPNVQENYTESQIREIIRCADPVTGPQYFLENYLYIQHPTTPPLGQAQMRVDVIV